MEKNLIKREGKQVSPKKRTAIFLNINVSCVATSMLGTALTTALPPIMEEFNISVNVGQWLTSGFALFLAVMTPITGYLITRFRTKRLYCTAIGFFIVGLTICACSNGFWMMMMGRIIQGCGNGLLASMAQVIILTIFPPEKIGTIMGWYGLSIGVAPIISPTIAGLLVDSVGWRMIFVIAISIMAISLICALFIFEDVLPVMHKKFDAFSLFLSAFAFGGITLAVGNIGTYKFVSYEVLLTLVVGLVAGAIFVWRQLHVEVPFLDIRVLKNKDYRVSLAATVILQLILMGSAIIFPVYVQQVKGYKATISGLMVLPGSLAMAVISPFAGKIYDKIGMRLLFIIGSITLDFSNFAIYFIDEHQSIWIVAFINIFRCLSFGALLMPLVTWAMKDIPKTKASDATALFNSIRFIGGAIGSALFISIMTKVAEAHPERESPKMYGINVVFLIMSVLSTFVLLLGVVGCHERTLSSKSAKNAFGKFNDVKIEISQKEMCLREDETQVEIVVGNPEDKFIESQSDETIVPNAIPHDNASFGSMTVIYDSYYKEIHNDVQKTGSTN